MLKIFYILLIVASFSCSLAQRDNNDYIVTRFQDTIYGQIKGRKNSYANHKLKFKEPGKLAKNYTAKQLESFYTNGLTYESVWLKLYREKLHEYYISRPNDGKKQFLRVVEKGKLSYYVLERPDHDNGTVDNIPLIKKENNQELVRVTQGLMGVRKKAVSDYIKECNDLATKIQSGQIKDPLEIVRFYNEWSKHSINNKSE
jgi:hypothetical protein